MVFQVVLLLLVFSLWAYGGANYNVDLSSVYYDGGYSLFPVKRHKIQERLNEINSQLADDGVKLYLPADPVLQHAIGRDEHVVMIIFGTARAVTFDEALTDQQKESVSTVTKGLWTEIPYLSLREGGKPEVTLQRMAFHEDLGDSIQPNVILPTPVIADLLSHETKGNNIDIHFVKGDLQLHLTGHRNEPCTFPGEHVLDDVNEYEHELQMSQSGPNFGICDRFPDLEVDLCDVYRNQTYAKILNEAGSNVCQYWKPTINVKSCKASIHISSMSNEMRTLLLLEDETQDAFESEMQSGYYDIRLVFPCFE